MKRFLLALFAVVVCGSLSYGQDCSSGTCSRPVSSSVERVARTASAPVRYVAKHKPVRGFVRRLCWR
jgi:hypothetical protein